MRLLPDGALDTAWKLFEEAFEILIIESSHAVMCSSNEQRNSMGSSFGCFPSPPSLPPPPVSVAIQRDLEAAEGLLFVSKLLQVTQDSEGNILWSIPRPQNDYGCILWLCQADAISSSWLCRFSSPHSQSNSLTCAVLLLCTAAGSFDAYLKPGHGGQMEYYFFSPNTWWNPALDFICCIELLKKTWHTHTKRNK